jgi:hypothetical protein
MPPPEAPPTALVTGASSGIGRALAACFAGSGHALVLVARSEAPLQALAQALREAHGVRVDVMPADLTAPGAIAALAAALRRKRRRIDVLVNNAGVLEQGPFVANDPGAHQRLIDLNISVPTALLAAFLPAMVKAGHGRVLNVASIASFQPVPGLAVYAASKAYVLSLTESLAEELRDTGVTATALCPGITATGMLDHATAQNPSLRALPAFVIGEVDAVAAEGHRACLAGEVIAVPGALNAAATWASRAAPKWLVRRVLGALGRGSA